MKLHLPKIRLPKRTPKTASNAQKKFWLRKKFWLCSCLTAVVIAGGVFVFGGMKRDNVFRVAAQNIGEARFFMMTGETNDVEVQLYTGVREEQFAINGTATKAKPFAMLKVTAKNNSVPLGAGLACSAEIGDDTLDNITLTTSSYVNDKNQPFIFGDDIITNVGLKHQIAATDTVKVFLNLGGAQPVEVTLVNPMAAIDEAVTWDAALHIATDKLADKLKGQKFETYVKIIDKFATESGAFWQVSFFTAQKTIHTCVVAPDGSVIG